MDCWRSSGQLELQVRGSCEAPQIGSLPPLSLPSFLPPLPPSLPLSLLSSPPSSERSRMDSLRSEFSAVERRWLKVKGEADEWGKLLDSIYPEMENFQVSSKPLSAMFANSISPPFSLRLCVPSVASVSRRWSYEPPACPP